MIVDTSLIEADRCVVITKIGELIQDSLSDIAESVVLVFLGKTIDFVHENFDVYRRPCLRQVGNCINELIESVKILVLRIDDPDDSTDLGKDIGLIEIGCEVVDVAWKFCYLEVHEGAGIDQEEKNGC